MKILTLFAMLSLAGFLIIQPHPQDDENCWGKDQRCADGKYRSPNGEVQPDQCAYREGDEHPCQCEKATDCEKGGPGSTFHPGQKCKTFCRPKACSCVTPGCS